MRHLAAAALFSLVIVGLPGCGGGRAESAIQEQIALMNEMADVMESDASEAEMKAKMEDIEKRQEALTKELEEIKVSEAEEKRLKEKYEPQMKEAMSRVMKAGFSRMSKGMEIPMGD